MFYDGLLWKQDQQWKGVNKNMGIISFYPRLYTLLHAAHAISVSHVK